MRPITFVLGTRPEIIKVAPLLREVASRDLPHVLIHTNQHYSPALDAIFFEQLRLAPPQHNLNVGAGSQTAQTARMMAGIDEILAATPASCLVVQGDTNSVLAGALTASKRDTPIAHVEAGLRSHDRAMPEEINRIITDHISDLLLTPTQDCSENLLAEGVDPQKIKLVGNTIVDSVMQNQSLISADLLDQYGLKPKEYFLATLHRPSNVDTEADLRELVETLAEVAEKSGFPMFFPAHPRTAGNLAKFGIDLPKSIMLHEPLGYFEFLTVQKYAR